MNLAGLLSRAALDRPDAVAIYRGDAPWARFAALAGRVAALAGALRGRLGLAPGDRVAVLMRNIPEYLESLYAIWWAGLVAVPVNAKLHPGEVHYILENSGARLVFASEDWLPGLAQAIQGLAEAPLVLAAGSKEYGRLCIGDRAPVASIAAGGLAWLFYTSGTTGRPKGAMLSHANLTRMTEAYFASVDAVPGEGRLLHAAPLSHGSGLYTFTHLSRSAGQVVPESGGFDAAEMLTLLEAHSEVSCFAAPTMVRRLVEAARAGDQRAPGLRTLVYGGAPMYLADLRSALEVLGERLAQIYGQGESPMTIAALAKAHHADRGHPRWLERMGSVGVAHHGIEIRIRDEAGADLPAGEAGEVCVRGATVMSGYWRDPQASAKAIRNGWLWTGDVGALDGDGFLTLLDRSKDLIISGGSNIYPREVEEVLLAHPSVAEVSVVGKRDAEWGEVPVAFVVARGAAPDPGELDALCLARIARFKRPKAYRFVEALPRNNYGKVLKSELREQLAGESAA